ncbi:MAG: hypothetical protein HKO76_05235 [Acidimicrobiia bacterium]|nr:hypothetical protein [Acidimicrobiia bacterium]
MGNRKWLGVVLSIVLAILGTFVLIRYVQSAEDRALADQETVEVLVVSDTIPEGATLEEVALNVSTKRIPVSAQALGSVSDLSQIEGEVTSVNLVPGEQIVNSRFTTLAVLESSQEIDVPDDLLEVTLSLSPERAVGGSLEPGDIVAYVASFEPFELSGAVASEEDNETVQVVVDGQRLATEEKPKTPNVSHIILHKLLVTSVQIEELPVPEAETAAEERGVELAPTGNLLITLAADAPAIEKMVFTAEFGNVWLAREGEEASELDTAIISRGVVYR